MEGINEVFHIDWKILIAQTVNFCIVAFVLWRFVFRPVSKILKERTEKIEGGLKMAEESKRRLTQTQKEIEKLVTEAKVESQKIIEKARDDAKTLREEEIGQSKLEAMKIIESGKKSLLAEKENILREIRGEAVDLLIKTSKTVLKDVGDSPEIDRKLAEKALAKIE